MSLPDTRVHFFLLSPDGADQGVRFITESHQLTASYPFRLLPKGTRLQFVSPRFTRTFFLLSPDGADQRVRFVTESHQLTASYSFRLLSKGTRLRFISPRFTRTFFLHIYIVIYIYIYLEACTYRSIAFSVPPRVTFFFNFAYSRAQTIFLSFRHSYEHKKKEKKQHHETRFH